MANEQKQNEQCSECYSPLREGYCAICEKQMREPSKQYEGPSYIKKG